MGRVHHQEIYLSPVLMLPLEIPYQGSVIQLREMADGEKEGDLGFTRQF
jgi:hypothetical protein